MTIPTPARRSPVRVLALGAALSLEACGSRAPEMTHNPPMPVPVDSTPPVLTGSDGAAVTPVEGAGLIPEAQAAGPPGAPKPAPEGPPPRTGPTESLPTRNPPPPPPPPPDPLPRWDEVASNHPEGATNPPTPVLVVQVDGARCWKVWRGGLRPPSPEERELGGQVVEVGAQVGGTEIQCPSEKARAVLEAHARGPAR